MNVRENWVGAIHLVKVLAVFMAACQVAAGLLIIQNPSFEEPVLADGGYRAGTFPGWSLTSAEAGVFNPKNPQYPGASDPGSGVPNGKQVAYINLPGSIYQLLTATVQPNMEYTLTVSVGDRKDMTVGQYSVELDAGSAVLGSASPPTKDGGFVTATVTYTAWENDPLIGSTLAIWLSQPKLVSGQQVNFDNVKLEATPVPECPAFAAVAAAGLAFFAACRYLKVMRCHSLLRRLRGKLG